MTILSVRSAIHPLKQVPVVRWGMIAILAILAFGLSACSTTGSGGRDGSRISVADSRSNPVELSREVGADTQLVKVEEPRFDVETRQLSPRQRRTPERTPEQAIAALTSMRSALNQNLDLCEGLNTSLDAMPVRRTQKPPFRQFYSDPAFRTRVVRITDSGFGQVVKPAYSTIQSWNADESLMILYHTGNQKQGHYLYNGKTYKRIKRLPIQPVDIEQVYWSHTEADYFYYVSETAPHFNKLVKYNARSGKSVAMADLSPMCGSSTVPTSGNDVQMPSLDDNIFTFRCSRGLESDMYMHSYNLASGEVKSAKIGDGSDWGNWNAPSISSSGERLRLEDAVISTDLETVLNYLNFGYDHEHSSMGQTSDGADALYAVSFDPAPENCVDDVDKGVGHLIEHNLETGQCRSLISQGKGYPYTASGTHISALAHLRPGWVAVSSVADPEKFVDLRSDESVEPLFSEIYLVNTNPDKPAVCRVAHHRSYAKSATNGGYSAYFGEPHVTISPSGTRLLFGSDWYDSGAVDTYVVELPVYSD